MSSIAPSTAEAELRRARADLESSLRAGGDRRTESLLATYPALAADTDAALELVYTEFVVRQELGQKPTPAEWFHRFPHWKTDLEQMFQVHDELCKSDAAMPVWARAPTLALDGGVSRSAPRVPGYELQGELGRGGMGVVYKARQVGLNRVVALKVILSGAHAGKKERDRFRLEAEAAAKLDHPQIVRIYDVGEHEGRPFCAMEFVDGITLAEKLTSKPWPIRVAVELIATVARAADHAHSRGIVHRDLKPANILLRKTEDPARFEPKIVDFGLAKHLDADGADPGPTRTGDVLGTPTYMAPEQAAGKAHTGGPGTDVWALGVVLYELLTGRPPFLGDTQSDTLIQVTKAEPVPPRRLREAIPRDVQTICLKCLAKAPAGRYATAAGLADDLERWLRGEPIVARPVGPIERARQWCGRNPTLAGLSTAVAGLLVAAVVAGVIAVVNLADAHRQAKKVADHEWAARQRIEIDFATEASRGNEERRRVARLRIAEGNRLLIDGDASGAALLFLEAMVNDPDADQRETHLVRIGTTLRAMPTLRQSFRIANTTEPNLYLSQDGSTAMAVPPSGPPVVWDLATAISRTVAVGTTIEPNQIQMLTSNGRAMIAVRDGRMMAWDTITGDVLPVPLPAWAGKLMSPFTPTGSRRVAYDHTNNTVRLFDPAGRPIGEPLRQDGTINSFHVSSHGGVVATGASTGKARVWDTDDGAPITPLLDHGSYITEVVMSQSGHTLATRGADGSVQLWDVKTGTPDGHRIQHGGGIQTPQFSPFGRWLATAGWAFGLRIWDTRTGRSQNVPMQDTTPITAFTFNPIGETVAIVDQQRKARVYHPINAVPLTPSLVFDNRLKARFSSDGRLLTCLTEDGQVRVWEIPPERAPGSVHHVGQAWRANWHPDNRTVISFGRDGGLVSVDGQIQAKLPHPGCSAGALGSATANPTLAATRSLDAGDVRIWNLATGLQQHTLLQRVRPSVIAFAPDGRLLIGGEDGTLRFWDPVAGTPSGPLWNHGCVAAEVTFSTDGSRMLVARRQDFFRLYDTTTLAVLASHTLSSSDPLPIFSPDGTRVAIPDRKGLIRFLAAADGQPTGTPIAVGSWIDHITYSPDGRWLVGCNIANRTVKLWSTETGRPLDHVLVASNVHLSHQTMRIAFSPDSRRLAIAGTAIRIWDIATGALVAPELAHQAITNDIHFSPDGRKLLTCSGDSSVRVWDLSPTDRPTEELTAYAQLLANRKLDERGKLVPLPADEEAALWQRFRPEPLPIRRTDD